jgi:hypothetical protein
VGSRDVIHIYRPSLRNEDVAQSDLLLLIKVVAVPALILTVSVAARRWGPSVGGFIIGLPLTSGPVLVFLALEQGVGFASAAAVGTLLGVLPLASYCATYSMVSFREGWQVTMAASTTVYFLVAALLSFAGATPLLALAAAIVAIAVALKIMPSGSGAVPNRVPPWWELPARMVAATSLVLLITEGASLLGSRWSGLLAPYPIYATVFAVFMQRYDGPDASAPFLRGVVVAALAAAAFFFTFASTVVALGILLAASLSLCATLAVEGSMLLFGRSVWRKEPRSA